MPKLSDFVSRWALRRGRDADLASAGDLHVNQVFRFNFYPLPFPGKDPFSAGGGGSANPGIDFAADANNAGTDAQLCSTPAQPRNGILMVAGLWLVKLEAKVVVPINDEEANPTTRVDANVNVTWSPYTSSGAWELDFRLDASTNPDLAPASLSPAGQVEFFTIVDDDAPDILYFGATVDPVLDAASVAADAQLRLNVDLVKLA